MNWRSTKTLSLLLLSFVLKRVEVFQSESSGIIFTLTSGLLIKTMIFFSCRSGHRMPYLPYNQYFNQNLLTLFLSHHIFSSIFSITLPSIKQLITQMQNLWQSMSDLLNTTLNLLKPPRSDPIKGVRVMSRRKLLWLGICFLQCCIFLLLDHFYPGDKYYYYRYNNMRTSFNLIIYVLLWQKTQYYQKEEDIKYLICVLTGVIVNIRPISFSYSMLIYNAIIGLQLGLCFFYIKQVYGMWAEGSTRTG